MQLPPSPPDSSATYRSGRVENMATGDQLRGDEAGRDFVDPLGVLDTGEGLAGSSSEGIGPKFGGSDEGNSTPDDLDFDLYLTPVSPGGGVARNGAKIWGSRGGPAGSLTLHASVGVGERAEEEEEDRDLFVVVDCPEKHMTTMESYMTFRVVTKTSRPEFEGIELQVRRRYNDFLWLRQRLEETQPTHIIPPLPEKHSLKRLDRFNEEFVRTRMGALQTFLQRVADHPVLSCNKNLFAFLTAKHAEFQTAKKEGSGVMSRWAGSLHSLSAAYMVKNRTLEFTEATAYIALLGEKLAVLERISQRVAKEQTELLAELAEWGPVFSSWSCIEDRLSVALSSIAKTVEQCHRALQDLVDATEAEFMNPVREYALYAEAIKVVLRKRDAIQMEYDLTVEELNRKTDDNDALSRQVEALSDKSTCANADLKADLDRWHKNKRKNFRRIFTGLADRQILYYQKCLRAWEEVLPQIQLSGLSVSPSAETVPPSTPPTSEKSDVANTS